MKLSIQTVKFETKDMYFNFCSGFKLISAKLEDKLWLYLKVSKKLFWGKKTFLVEATKN
jgi:hypothetical protein